MIREIAEEPFVETFFDLMAEVELGDHFNPQFASHQQHVGKKISNHYYIGTKFFAFFDNDDRPMGFVGVLREEKLDGVPCIGQYSELLDIAIFPEYRGSGLGTRLLKHAENVSKEAKVYCMYMATYVKSHEVIAFYGKAGYVPVATMPDVHGPDDEGRVWMRKIL